MEYIPDLSEIQSDFLAKQVADAPSISICHLWVNTLIINIFINFDRWAWPKFSTNIKDNPMTILLEPG